MTIDPIHLTREKLGDGPDPVLPEIRAAYPELHFLFNEIDDARYGEDVDVRQLQDDVSDLEEDNARLRANLSEARKRFKQIKQVTTEHVVRDLAEQGEAYFGDIYY